MYEPISRRISTLSLSLSVAPLVASILFFALPAQAALYAPGETLDPACAPTDVDCGIEAQVGDGTTGQVPYYAADGGVLTATSSLTILSNGRIGVGTTTPYSIFAISNSASTPINIPLFTIASTTAGTATSTLFTVLASGNVGIGTTSPTTALSVNGNITIAGSSGRLLRDTDTTSLALIGGLGKTTSAYIQINADGASTVGTIENIIKGTGDFRVASAPLGSGTQTQLFRILASGNVGIGSTTPWRTLSVVGTVAFNGLTSSATGNAVCITTAKDITDAGGASCVPSSIRFKENVETLSQGFALEELNKLRVVSFDYKEGFYSPEDAPGSYGLIAEEVEEIDPLLVDYGYDGKPLTLRFDKLLGLAIQAIQNISEKIDGFAHSFTSERVKTDTLCLDDVCITKNELQNLLEESNQPSAPTPQIPEEPTPPPTDEEPSDEIITEEPVVEQPVEEETTTPTEEPADTSSESETESPPVSE